MAGNRAVETAVKAVVPIISEHKVIILPARHRAVLDFVRSKGFDAVEQIRFGQFLAVHEQVAVFKFHNFTGERHDAFHAIGAVRGVPEDDNFAAAGCAKVINPTVKKIAIGIVQRGPHAGADDFHGLQDVAADQEIAGGGQDRHDDALADLLESGIDAPGRGGVRTVVRGSNSLVDRQRLGIHSYDSGCLLSEIMREIQPRNNWGKLRKIELGKLRKHAYWPSTNNKTGKWRRRFIAAAGWAPLSILIWALILFYPWCCHWNRRAKPW